MIIQITGRLDTTKTIPDRAEVAVGETVQWSIEATGRASFPRKKPFPAKLLQRQNRDPSASSGTPDP